MRLSLWVMEIWVALPLCRRIVFATDLASGEEDVFMEGGARYFKVLGNTLGGIMTRRMGGF